MNNNYHAIFLLSAFALCTSLSFAADNKIPVPLLGVTYNGLHATPNPTTAQVSQELAEIGQKFDYARTYYPKYAGGDKTNIVLADQAKAKVKLLLGLYMHDNKQWIIDDYKNYIQGAIKNNNDQAIIGVLVGNENLDGNNETGKLAEIETLIDMVKADALKMNQNIPVSSVQTYADWLGPIGAKLAAKVDFIAANIYPAWCWNKSTTNNPDSRLNSLPPVDVDDGCRNLEKPLDKPMTVDEAYNSFIGHFNTLQSKYPNKQIVVTETGYPTAFGKNVGLGSDTARSYACQYLQKISNWANSTNQAVFIYEMFDSKAVVNESSAFNYNFGIQGKFPIPSFKNNNFHIDCLPA